jgi:hypothetical protein
LTLFHSEPLVGAACDTFVLGHEPTLIAEHLRMFERDSDRIRAHNLSHEKKEDFLFPLPLMFATLAYGTHLAGAGGSIVIDLTMDAALIDPYRAMHFRVAGAYCERLLKEDEETAARFNLLTPDIDTNVKHQQVSHSWQHLAGRCLASTTCVAHTLVVHALLFFSSHVTTTQCTICRQHVFNLALFYSCNSVQCCSCVRCAMTGSKFLPSRASVRLPLQQARQRFAQRQTVARAGGTI